MRLELYLYIFCVAQACNNRCLSCSPSDIDICYSCKPGYYLNDGQQCLSYCPDGFYKQDYPKRVCSRFTTHTNSWKFDKKSEVIYDSILGYPAQFVGARVDQMAIQDCGVFMRGQRWALPPNNFRSAKVILNAQFTIRMWLYPFGAGYRTIMFYGDHWLEIELDGLNRIDIDLLKVYFSLSISWENYWQEIALTFNYQIQTQASLTFFRNGVLDNYYIRNQRLWMYQENENALYWLGLHTGNENPFHGIIYSYDYWNAVVSPLIFSQFATNNSLPSITNIQPFECYPCTCFNSNECQEDNPKEQDCQDLCLNNENCICQQGYWYNSGSCLEQCNIGLLVNGKCSSVNQQNDAVSFVFDKNIQKIQNSEAYNIICFQGRKEVVEVIDPDFNYQNSYFDFKDNQVLSINGKYQYQFQDDFYVSIWLKLGEFSQIIKTIFWKKGLSLLNIYIKWEQIYFEMKNQQDQILLISPNLMQQIEWQLIMISYTELNQAHLYVDGSLIGTKQMVNFTDSKFYEEFLIGNNDQSEYFIGSIYQVKFASQYLSNGEIQQHYTKKPVMLLSCEFNYILIKGQCVQANPFSLRFIFDNYKQVYDDLYQSGVQVQLGQIPEPDSADPYESPVIGLLYQKQGQMAVLSNLIISQDYYIKLWFKTYSTRKMTLLEKYSYISNQKLLIGIQNNEVIVQIDFDDFTSLQIKAKLITTNWTYLIVKFKDNGIVLFGPSGQIASEDSWIQGYSDFYMESQITLGNDHQEETLMGAIYEIQVHKDFQTIEREICRLDPHHIVFDGMSNCKDEDFCQDCSYGDKPQNFYFIFDYDSNQIWDLFEQYYFFTFRNPSYFFGSGFYTGNNGYLAMLSDQKFLFPLNKFSIQIWIYPTLLEGQQTIFSFENLQYNQQVNINISSANISAEIQFNPNQNSFILQDPGEISIQWILVSMSFNELKATVWINDLLKVQQSVDVQVNNITWKRSSIQLGQKYILVNNFKGYIYSIRLENSDFINYSYCRFDKWQYQECIDICPMNQYRVYGNCIETDWQCFLNVGNFKSQNCSVVTGERLFIQPEGIFFQKEKYKLKAWMDQQNEIYLSDQYYFSLWIQPHSDGSIVHYKDLFVNNQLQLIQQYNVLYFIRNYKNDQIELKSKEVQLEQWYSVTFGLQLNNTLSLYINNKLQQQIQGRYFPNIKTRYLFDIGHQEGNNFWGGKLYSIEIKHELIESLLIAHLYFQCLPIEIWHFNLTCVKSCGQNEILVSNECKVNEGLSYKINWEFSTNNLESYLDSFSLLQQNTKLVKNEGIIFDGISSILYLKPETSIDLSKFALGIWIRPLEQTQRQVVFSKQSNINDNSIQLIFIDQQYIFQIVRNENQVNAQSYQQSMQWTYVTVVSDQSNHKIFVNQALENQVNLELGEDQIENYSFVFGGQFKCCYFYGYIYQITILQNIYDPVQLQQYYWKCRLPNLVSSYGKCIKVCQIKTQQYNGVCMRIAKLYDENCLFKFQNSQSIKCNKKFQAIRGDTLEIDENDPVSTEQGWKFNRDGQKILIYEAFIFQQKVTFFLKFEVEQLTGKLPLLLKRGWRLDYIIEIYILDGFLYFLMKQDYNTIADFQIMIEDTNHLTVSIRNELKIFLNGQLIEKATNFVYRENQNLDIFQLGFDGYQSFRGVIKEFGIHQTFIETDFDYTFNRRENLGGKDLC